MYLNVRQLVLPVRTTRLYTLLRWRRASGSQRNYRGSRRQKQLSTNRKFLEHGLEVALLVFGPEWRPDSLVGATVGTSVGVAAESTVIFGLKESGLERNRETSCHGRVRHDIADRVVYRARRCARNGGMRRELENDVGDLIVPKAARDAAGDGLTQLGVQSLDHGPE